MPKVNEYQKEVDRSTRIQALSFALEFSGKALDGEVNTAKVLSDAYSYERYLNGAESAEREAMKDRDLLLGVHS